MKRQIVAVGASLLTVSLGAAAGSAQARAATLSMQTAETPTWVCTLDPAHLATAQADEAAGMTAAQICATNALPGPAGAADAAIANEENLCGEISEDIIDNDPHNGWFHEEPDWDMGDTGYITSYTITAQWVNYTTYNSNEYTWGPTTGVFKADESFERDVDSGAGAVQAQALATGTVWSTLVDNNGACQGDSLVNSFPVS
jgi:hypothetical protein